jgi:hypothetical protein
MEPASTFIKNEKVNSIIQHDKSSSKPLEVYNNVILGQINTSIQELTKSMKRRNNSSTPDNDSEEKRKALEHKRDAEIFERSLRVEKQRLDLAREEKEKNDLSVLNFQEQTFQHSVKAEEMSHQRRMQIMRMDNENESRRRLEESQCQKTSRSMEIQLEHSNNDHLLNVIHAKNKPQSLALTLQNMNKRQKIVEEEKDEQEQDEEEEEEI